ncbi:hypothetical protein IWQ60_006483 [Tieghemiomyces parasiticus]|uniref:RRM domain-containing protein n=1 Tax=Tieghemiomyces parasiticus TaxID=78921 RepID=A0A9W8A9T4_9FUNG|nr:hypothetical protein IWQ60_006483 [Tieghemiomyces parasiticus]
MALKRGQWDNPLICHPQFYQLLTIPVRAISMMANQPCNSAGGATADADADANSPANDSSIFICNLDVAVSEYAVLKLFQPFGEIKELKFPFHHQGPRQGQARGYCFLEYTTPAAAAGAILAVNGRTFKGRPLVVKPCSVPKRTNRDDASARPAGRLGRDRHGTAPYATPASGTVKRTPLTGSSRIALPPAPGECQLNPLIPMPA